MDPTVTPEQPVEILENYAGFWLRAAAIIIDFLILSVPVYYLATLLGEKANVHLSNKIIESNINLFNTARVFLIWLYFALLESSPRQATFGKQALGIYVTNYDGSRITFFKATLRYFTKSISLVTLGIGFLMAAFTARKQALHDLVAATLVLKNAKKR